jgi:TolB protein
MKTITAVLLLPFMVAMADDFLPMTPIGADRIPVTIRVTGDRELAVDAADQLGDDIDFSGLLMTAPDGEGYAEADVEVRNTSEGVELRAEVTSGGERLLSRSYTGSSIYTLVHAFADDLVFDLTGENGIASTRIAYVSRTDAGYALVTKYLDPRGAARLMLDEEPITTPSWSPDGGRIAFASFQSGNCDLWMYTFAGASAARLLSAPGLNASPTWSPDGGMMAVTLSRSGNVDIYSLDPSTGQTSRLTTRESIETSPSFSPTGAQIVFTSDRIGYPQLYIMDASGGTGVRATTSHGYCDSPAWSPDGERIAYTARSGSDFHIFVMDSDGSNVRQVTFDGSLNEDPVWGPTGRHLAFSSDMEGGRAIFVVELNGLTVRRLSEGSECYCPTWSPLGS